MDREEYFGIWWLPENPDEKIEGTLRLFKDGIKLEIAKTFSGIQNFLPEGNRSVPIILGAVSGYPSKVTLCNSQVWTHQTWFEGHRISKHEFIVSEAFLGDHFNNPADITFRKVKVKYTYLRDFTGTGDFQYDYNEETTTGELVNYRITYVPGIKAKAITADENTVISVEYIPLFEPGYTLDNNMGEAGFTQDIKSTSIDLRQEVVMSFEAGRPLSYGEWLSKFVYPLQDFLTFATTIPNQLVEIVFFGHKNAVQMLYQSPPKKEIQKVYNLRERQQMLFILAEIDDFNRVMDRWFRISSDLEVVCSLFFNVYYNPDMNVHHKFLNLVQALESYHRERFTEKGQAFSSEDYEVLKRVLREAINGKHEDYTEWLEGRLKHGNEISLRQRFKMLIDEYTEQIISSLITNKSSFINSVIEIRNLLTHPDASSQKKPLDVSELSKTIDVLSYLLQGWFLKELGFSREKSVEFFNRYRPYFWRVSELEFEKSRKTSTL